MADTKVYLPKQQIEPRRGVAGYKGKDIVVVDPATGNEKPATKSGTKR